MQYQNSVQNFDLLMQGPSLYTPFPLLPAIFAPVPEVEIRWEPDPRGPHAGSEFCAEFWFVDAGSFALYPFPLLPAIFIKDVDTWPLLFMYIQTDI